MHKNTKYALSAVPTLKITRVTRKTLINVLLVILVILKAGTELLSAIHIFYVFLNTYTFNYLFIFLYL